MFGFDRPRIRYDMFDLAKDADEAKRVTKIGTLYHHGQELAWDGRAVLRELLAKHGGVHLATEKRQALGRIFDTILWGELAAWKISADLANRVVPLEAKMAATSQAHDEARHFYVMYDYLIELGHTPKPLGRASEAMLNQILGARGLAEKILGMQLQVESQALTLFQAVRETGIEPVLGDLLRYYEKDEARHVGLGIQYLPALLRALSPREGLMLMLFNLKIVALSLASVKAIEPDLRVLGLDARRIVELGRAKQILVFKAFREQVGTKPGRFEDLVSRAVSSATEVLFPRGEPPRGLRELGRAIRVGWERELADSMETSIDSP